jgi:DUF4097 and DUF4098 domain-containing protein YvlB
MSDRPISVPVPGNAELHLMTRSGRIAVIGEERSDVLIESGASSRGVESDATGRVRITSAKGGSTALSVRCPAGSDVVIGTMSGQVDLRGTLGAVRVTTVSSSIAVERADSLDVRTISGSIEVGACTDQCSLRTKSGKASIGSAGDAFVSTISGTIRLGRAARKVRAQTVSGGVRVGTQSEGDVKVQTLSGAVTVEVPQGVRPDAHLASMTGRPRCDCPAGSDCRIAVRSVSGRIEVVCA